VKCDTHHYLVVIKIRDRLAVCKQRMHRILIEKFNLRKLNEIQSKAQYLLRSQISLQLWKIWMMRWILIVLRKLTETVSKFQPWRV
jgi:hypothetical protein